MAELSTENFEYILDDLKSSKVRKTIIAELADHLALLTEDLMDQSQLDFQTAYQNAKLKLDRQDVLELNQSLFYYRVILNKPLIGYLGVFLGLGMCLGLYLKLYHLAWAGHRWFIITNLLLSYLYFPLLTLHLFTQTYRKLSVLLLFMILLSSNFYLLAFFMKWSARSYLKWPVILFVVLIAIQRLFSTKN